VADALCTHTYIPQDPLSCVTIPLIDHHHEASYGMATRSTGTKRCSSFGKPSVLHFG
jgi:hypothetical protein